MKKIATLSIVYCFVLLLAASTCFAQTSLFAPVVTYDSGGNEALSLAVADVNGDGKPDLVVANDCGSSSNCSSSGTVAVLLGNGDGTFQPAVSYSTGGYDAGSVAVADVNGDGKPDLLVANACSEKPQPKRLYRRRLGGRAAGQW